MFHTNDQNLSTYTSYKPNNISNTILYLKYKFRLFTIFAVYFWVYFNVELWKAISFYGEMAALSMYASTEPFIDLKNCLQSSPFTHCREIRSEERWAFCKLLQIESVDGHKSPDRFLSSCARSTNKTLNYSKRMKPSRVLFSKYENYIIKVFDSYGCGRRMINLIRCFQCFYLAVY